MKLTRLSTALLAACGAPLLLNPVFAADEETAERVEVVGSHIKRTDIEGPSPVLSISREEIDKSGYNNLQQLLEKLPIAGTGTFSTRGNNQDSTANGAAAVSLRGFGADATLVLINGRRVAISAFAENVVNNFVDINSIPVAAIERVEVLKDGASALYGSDAVAGVVNIVLRKDFVGTEVSVGYGNTTDTDNSEKTVTALWGVNGENSNVTLIFDYFSNNTLANKDRGDIGSANQESNGGVDLRSSRGFPGQFVVDGVITIDPNCPAGSVAGQTCLYDYGPWNLLTPASERTGLMLLGRRDISSNVELFTEISVQHNTSIAQGAPTPLDETAGLTVPVSHPNNPFAGATTIDIRRLRTVDAGARQFDIETDNLRAVLGLRGTISEWDWEVSAQKGRSESTQTGNKSQGWVRTDFLQAEINAGRYNPFGGTYNSPAVIDAITTNLVRQGESHLTAVDAQLSGDLFEMGGGMAGMAVGLDYREEDASDVPDDQFQRGLIFGTESVSASASREQWSAFIEFALPVFQNFELQLAARYDDYSDFGTTTNPKVAVRWAPLDNLAFRASWGEGFRAPSLAQIGLGPSQESQFFLDTYGCADNAAYCAPTDYNIIFSGNPDLEPEESETWNVGITWDITEGADVSVDFWSIEQDNKIDEGDFGTAYLLNCNVQSSTVCVRGAPLPGDTLGALQSVHNGYENLTSQEAQGVDLSTHYRLDLGGAGTVRFGLEWTYLSNFEKDGRDYTGEWEFPQYRWTGSADWSSGDVGVLATLHYIGEFEDTPDQDFDGALDFDQYSTPKVDAMMVLNLQARYTGIANTALIVGLDNALDEEPPFAAGDGDDDLYGYASRVHSPRGQFAYAKVTYTF